MLRIVNILVENILRRKKILFPRAKFKPFTLVKLEVKVSIA